MKKIVYLNFAFLCFTAIAMAQTTAKTLQGTWKIDAIQTAEVYYELATGKLTIDPAATADQPMAPEDLAMAEDMMKTQLEPFASNFIQFNDSKIIIKFGTEQREGTYTIKEKDGKQYIEATYGTGGVKEIEFTLKDKFLSIIQTAEGKEGKMIYKLS